MSVHVLRPDCSRIKRKQEVTGAAGIVSRLPTILAHCVSSHLVEFTLVRKTNGAAWREHDPSTAEQ